VQVCLPSSPRLTRRILSALLLAGFLAHAGDGLVAMMCAPGMEHGQAHEDAVPPGAGAERGEHHQHQGTDPAPGGEGDHDQGDEPCPLGPSAMAFCGGAATVPTASSSHAPRVPFGNALTLADPSDAFDTLLSLKLFRPPRA
jgi:hypothetical protein